MFAAASLTWVITSGPVLAEAVPAPITSHALQLALAQSYDFANAPTIEPLRAPAFEAGPLFIGASRPAGPSYLDTPSLFRDLFNLSDSVEVEVTAGFRGPADLDFAFARRTRVQETPVGAIVSEGGEIRLGQRLSIDEWETPTWDRPAWYFFAGGDGQALTWAPGPATDVSGVRYQERVDVGDMQAGVSIEANNMQASFALMQREISNNQRSEQQNHVGLSLTWRR